MINAIKSIEADEADEDTKASLNKLAKMKTSPLAIVKAANKKLNEIYASAAAFTHQLEKLAAEAGTQVFFINPEDDAQKFIKDTNKKLGDIVYRPPYCYDYQDKPKDA